MKTIIVEAGTSPLRLNSVNLKQKHSISRNNSFQFEALFWIKFVAGLSLSKCSLWVTLNSSIRKFLFFTCCDVVVVAVVRTKCCCEKVTRLDDVEALLLCNVKLLFDVLLLLLWCYTFVVMVYCYGDVMLLFWC